VLPKIDSARSISGCYKEESERNSPAILKARAPMRGELPPKTVRQGAFPLRACLGRATQFVASYLHARCEGDEGEAAAPTGPPGNRQMGVKCVPRVRTGIARRRVER